MDILFWACVAVLCTLVLFMEASRIVVALFISHQALWRYLFVLVPLAVSAGSFLVTLDVFNRWEVWVELTSLHLDPLVYQELRAQFYQLSSPCQHAAVITLIVLALMIFLERYLLPSGSALLAVGRARDRVLADQVLLSRRYL